ncbi:MAG: hypothetical protein ABSG43_23715 [Solirubrobacteraceae bacterium]
MAGSELEHACLRSDAHRAGGAQQKLISGKRDIARMSLVADVELEDRQLELARVGDEDASIARNGSRRAARLGEAREIRDCKEFGDVDMLLGETRPHDVVAVSHDLDSDAAHIGVDLPRGKKDGLARQQVHSVQQQGQDRADVIGEVAGG